MISELEFELASTLFACITIPGLLFVLVFFVAWIFRDEKKWHDSIDRH